MFRITHSISLCSPSLRCLFSVSFPVSDSPQTLSFPRLCRSPLHSQVSTPNLLTLWPLLWSVDLDQKATALSRAFSHTGGGIVQLLHLASPFMLILSLGPGPTSLLGVVTRNRMVFVTWVAQGV